MAVHLPVVQDEPLSEEDLAAAAAERPRTRGDCAAGPRPCPWISCRHHLLTERRHDVWNPGQSKPYRPRTLRTDEEILQALEGAPETCALDVADRVEQQAKKKKRGLRLRDIAELFGLERERIRQIEEGALAELLGEVREEDRPGPESLTLWDRMGL